MPSGVVDANIVLRVLTDEPRPLAARATALLTAVAERGLDAVLAPLTIAEIVYVLAKVYGWPRFTVADRLLEILEGEVFVVIERDVVLKAMRWYRNVATLDFADAYVAALAAERTEGVVFSFDRDLRRLPGVRVVDSAEEQ